MELREGAGPKRPGGKIFGEAGNNIGGFSVLVCTGRALRNFFVNCSSFCRVYTIE